MALASTYDGKLRVINDILDKTSADERKIMLQMLIKKDMKTYFEVIWDEQKRLETEAGVEGVCEFTSEKAWVDGEERKAFDDISDEKASGIEINLAGKVSKEAENAYYLDEKIDKKQGNDKFDGFLGYVNSSGNDENESDLVVENDEISDLADKLERVNLMSKSEFIAKMGKNESTFEKSEVQFENQTVLETTLEAGEFVDKIADKIEELEMKTKMKNMKFPDFGGEK